MKRRAAQGDHAGHQRGTRFKVFIDNELETDKVLNE